ncbi:molybdopterin-dependent oxidoreductase [Roseiconus nitratireducens]|uniref:Molybdopterin-dependent oxidoreductase n=1 Tax=Roseiconus nitratireducens TaxID=2605748 RepID=A0A5M6DH29_9BACT|nr:molybdopterin cofactor-binding domain-containing protein [Roseiconus nitratireducens]KAA5546858.1 molybdopterin-dependent oxidoreductase [Roseiconus nitratireducens]
MARPHRRPIPDLNPPSSDPLIDRSPSNDDLSIDDEPLEVERYELREPPRYRFAANRREFTQVVGAGLLITVSARTAHAQRRGRSARREELLSQRFQLGDDGIVTVLTSKVSVGQGARTQLSQAAAEELGLPIDRIRLVMADTQRCPDDGGTAGSRTTPSTVPRVRNAAAALRGLLHQFAAEQFDLNTEQVTYSEGVFRGGDQQQLSLSELARDEALQERLNAAPSEDASIVPIDRWRVLGTSVDKVDGPAVVTGQTKYPSDIQLPGMLYGKVLRPTSYGATLASVDLTPAQQLDDVVVVRDGDFIGCAAPTSWRAAKARDAIAATCQWKAGSSFPSDQLFDRLKRSGDSQGDRGRDVWGNPAEGTAKAKQTVRGEYEIAYVQHAPMEPRAAVAQWQDDQLTVWTGTQQPARVHGELCQTFRLSPQQARVIVPDTGGGFGGKHTGEAAVEAARLAKAAGRPVSLRWTRDEEFTWAYFRPAGVITVHAGLDAAGDLCLWEFTNYNSGGSAIETPYKVPHGSTRFVRCDAPLRQGSYRALASTANTFARESAMDELAARSDADPLDFRLRHLADGRLKDVLKAAADAFHWPRRVAETGQGEKPNQRGVGLACGTEKGSFVAACAEVEIRDGELHVVEVCQAFECGAVHNPRNLRAQQVGALMMGLGGALTESIEFSEGKITNPSFSSYRVPRLSDLPKLNIVQLNRPDLPSVGAGETPIIAIAPAVANALFAATGTRCRSMPLRLS